MNELKTNQRIIIIGAGPSGVHMAHLLKEQGFDDIIVLERSETIGGKSETTVVDGVPHEMGTCYLHPGYTRLLSLLEQRRLTSAVKPGGLLGRRDLFEQDDRIEPPDLAEWLLAAVERRTLPKSLRWLPDRAQLVPFLAAVQKYSRLHKRFFGESNYTMPQQPTDDTLEALDMTFGAFLESHGLTALIPLFLLSHSAQGYGLMDTIPAWYGMWWNTPALLQAFLDSSRNDDAPVLMMLRDGYQSVWTELAKQHQLDIRTGVRVTSIDRPDAGPVRIYTRIGALPQVFECDKVFVTCPLPSAAKLLDVRPEEAELFAMTHTSMLTTTLIRTPAEDAASCIGYWPDRLRVGLPGRLYSRRDSLASIRPLDLRPGQPRTWVTYQYSDNYQPHSEPELLDRLLADLEQHGITDVEVLQQRVWPYFNRFTQHGLNQRAPWRLFDLQGRYHTYYIGGSACFESVNDIMSYNEQVLEQALGLQRQVAAK